MKKDPRSIIERPLITEKNHLLQDIENKYVFEVARYANKLEIKLIIIYKNHTCTQVHPIKSTFERLEEYQCSNYS